MKLIDLLDVLTERSNVAVAGEESDEFIATYDGRNSIDPKFNNAEVLSVDFCAEMSLEGHFIDARAKAAAIVRIKDSDVLHVVK